MRGSLGLGGEGGFTESRPLWGVTGRSPYGPYTVMVSELYLQG